MTLEIQIFTLLYSFLFGIFYSIGYVIFKKWLYHRIWIIKMITNFLFCFSMMFLYYLVIEKVNGGILHPYGIISSFVGFCLGYLLFTKYKK